MWVKGHSSDDLRASGESWGLWNQLVCSILCGAASEGFCSGVITLLLGVLAQGAVVFPAGLNYLDFCLGHFLLGET